MVLNLIFMIASREQYLRLLLTKKSLFNQNSKLSIWNRFFHLLWCFWHDIKVNIECVECHVKLPSLNTILLYHQNWENEKKLYALHLPCKKALSLLLYLWTKILDVHFSFFSCRCSQKLWGYHRTYTIQIIVAQFQ